MEGLEGMRERFLCVRESQVNEFVQIKTQHLPGSSLLEDPSALELPVWKGGQKEE